MDLKTKEDIIRLYEKHFKEEMTVFELLPASGSYREYCRIKSANFQAIGAHNADVKENQAFISFTNHFFAEGMPVPEIYAVNPEETCYIQEDLGNLTLFDYLSKTRERKASRIRLFRFTSGFCANCPNCKLRAGQGIDYSFCYPRAAFDKQSMMWDLNYFKYYFLKLAKIPFDEQALEDDFKTFTKYLLQAESDYFLYRDFQSRNIMLRDNKVAFYRLPGRAKRFAAIRPCLVVVRCQGRYPASDPQRIA